MTDILYILGQTTDNNDFPLRWSLRSLEKYGQNIGKVIIAGKIPKWISSKVIACPIDQSKIQGKEWKILYTELQAIKQLNLQKPLLFSADDHYFCRKAKLDAWPRYFSSSEIMTYRQYCQQKIIKPLTLYQICLMKTRDALMEDNLPFQRRYAVHLNTWIDPADVNDVEKFVDMHYRDIVSGLETQMIWGSIWESKHPKEKWIKYYNDRKVFTIDDYKKKLIDKLPMCSTSEKIEANSEFIKYMKALFPKKSRWEK